MPIYILVPSFLYSPTGGRITVFESSSKWKGLRQSSQIFHKPSARYTDLILRGDI